MPDGDKREDALWQRKKSIFEYNSENLSAIRSQPRPIGLGFAARQRFDTDEAFDSVLGR